MNNKNRPQLGEKTKRNFTVADLRAADTTENNQGVISGHAAVFNQITNIGGIFNEVIEPGAFDNTDFTDVLFSVNHDLDKIPLARSRRNTANSTLQLQVDNIGLAVRANLDIENNMDAKGLYSAVSRGDINGMSFIFYVGAEEWQDLNSDMPTRHIRSIDKVIEVSAVSFPAYTGTDINSRDESVLDNAQMVLDNARSSRLDNLGQEKQNQLELEKLKAEILFRN